MTILEKSHRFQDLGPLLRPKSVAIIGASEKPGNLGGVAVALMQKFGYSGDIWPINPKRARVHGLPCYPSVGDLPSAADLAVIATGAETAERIVRDCATAGIRNGVIWAGGYAEIGAQGATLQDKLVRTCRETGFTLVGPNSIGIINAGDAMVASFASFLVEAETLIPGNIAMISQSGGLATMAQAMAQRKKMGFGLTVSTGNEAILTAADYIHAAAADPKTKLIAVYLEGVRDGPKFIDAVRFARAAGKPVVVLKGGLTATSAQAAAAHTGAFAGESRVWEAIASELGIITVGSLEELLDVSLFLSRANLAKLPKGNGVAVISFGGGSGVLSADQCEAHGLVIPPLMQETRARLQELVTPIASIQNPIDLTPQTFNQERWFATFSDALDTIAADPNIDIVLCQFGPMALRGRETAQIISNLQHRTEKTICISWPLAPAGVPEILESEGVYVFQEYERAIATLGKLATLRQTTQRNAEARRVHAAFDWDAQVPHPKPGLVISEDECHRLLSQIGISTARGALARSEADAIEIAREIGFPLAIKGISAAITHRAASGLVALDIRDEEDLLEAYRRLTARAASDGNEIDGLYLQEMIRSGLEVIVSAFRDPVFGTMVSCGWGGNLTELIDDVILARAPLDALIAEQLLQRLRIVQGATKLNPSADIKILARFLEDFSVVAASVPWTKFVIELNPVKWDGVRATAVDGLIIIEDP